MQDWQSQSCAYGFDGWLTWTWDTTEQADLWTATEADETVNRALAPQARPDPCAGTTPVVGPPSDPAALTPAAGDTLPTNAATMTWTAASPAETYQLQVATDLAFTGLVYDSATIPLTSHTVEHLAVGVVHYWRVRALTLEGTSAWTEARSFVPLLPAPAGTIGLEPAAESIVDPLPATFRSTSSTPNIDTYEFTVATDSLFANVLADSMRADTTCAIRLPDPWTTFWWRTRAHNDAGWSSWSPAIRFYNVRTLGVAEPRHAAVALLGSVPSPVATVARIRFRLPAAVPVRVRVVDVRGRVVRDVFLGPLGAGEQSVLFDRAGLPPGLYFYRLETPTARVADKIVVVH